MGKVNETTRLQRMQERAGVLDPGQKREMLETLDLETDGLQAERLREQLHLRSLIRRDWAALSDAGKVYFRAALQG